MNTTSSYQAAMGAMPRASLTAVKWTALLLGAVASVGVIAVVLSILPMVALWRFGLESAEFWSTSLATISLVFLGMVNSQNFQVAWKKWRAAEREMRRELRRSMAASSMSADK